MGAPPRDAPALFLDAFPGGLLSVSPTGLIVGVAVVNGASAIASATASDVLVALAPAINTGILCYLAWWSHRHHKEVAVVKELVKENTDVTLSAATAAAAAASTAADAARITREIGGALRHVEPPVTGATDVTPPQRGA